jgi:ribose transport system substrate-binding protein
MARTAAEYADEWLQGKRAFEQKIMVAIELVSKDNVNDYGGFGRTE